MKYYIYASKLDLDFKATVMRIIAGMGSDIDLSPAERRSAADFTIRLVPRVYLDNFHIKKEFYAASGKEIRFSFTIDDTRIYIDGTTRLEGHLVLTCPAVPQEPHGLSQFFAECPTR